MGYFICYFSLDFFFLIVIRNSPGCAWTGINQKFHRCVDSVLNASLDKELKENGISAKLLKTDGGRLWIIGLLLLLVFAFILTINSILLDLRLIMLGVISSLYFLYEKPFMILVLIDRVLKVKLKWEEFIKNY
jgi:hypothetical protein